MVRPRNEAQRQEQIRRRLSGYSWSRGSLNDFLRSEQCRRVVEQDMATFLLEALEDHGVEISCSLELGRFATEHPDLFRELTTEKIAQGVESTRSIYAKFNDWTRNWHPTLKMPRWSELVL
jgi:hypothetical protein